MKPVQGVRVPDDQLYELFEAQEGGIQAILGRIRQGKTTEAVRRMYESLSNGRVVYSNVRLDLSNLEFDDREVAWYVFKNILWFNWFY